MAQVLVGEDPRPVLRQENQVGMEQESAMPAGANGIVVASALAQRQFAWQQRKATLGVAAQCVFLTEARKELDWVADLPAQSGQQVLLVRHNKIDLWLYPGGHIDPNEDPAEAALREVHAEWVSVENMSALRTPAELPALITEAARLMPQPA